MDKYRIKFKCKKIPRPNSGIEGFNIEKIYTGRSFNTLYEISSDWGSGKPTKLIPKEVFEEYFEVVNKK